MNDKASGMDGDKGRPATIRPIRSIGVIGLGAVGRAICRRLAGAGARFGLRKVAGFDPDKAVLAALDEGEIVACTSVAHLVDRVDLVLLCLPGAGDAGKIARSHDGLLDCVRQGQIVVDHSPSSLDLTRQLATAFAKRGALFLDAPIGRSAEVGRAIDSGRLAFAIGGEASAIDAVLPLLGCFAGDISRVGAAGTAQVVRQMHDLVTLQTFSALAEALMTAEAFGVEGGTLLDALAKGHGDSVGMARRGLADFLGIDDDAQKERTSIAEAGRRLSAAIQLAEGRNLSLSGAGSTLALFEKAIEKGLGETDLSGLFSAMAPETPKRMHRDARQRG